MLVTTTFSFSLHCFLHFQKLLASFEFQELNLLSANSLNFDESEFFLFGKGLKGNSYKLVKRKYFQLLFIAGNAGHAQTTDKGFA